jgi:RNA polymerase sigma-70 factor, ECF subfamily
VDDAARAELESRARALCAGGDFDRAATVAVRGYGPELLGFLIAVHRSEADASDVFSEVAEAVWKGMPTFAWESTLRTWTYAIARNVTRARRRDAARKERRGARAGDSALDRVAQAVRTETLGFLRTEKRTRLQALRDGLPEEDRMLLVLRSTGSSRGTTSRASSGTRRGARGSTARGSRGRRRGCARGSSS